MWPCQLTKQLQQKPRSTEGTGGEDDIGRISMLNDDCMATCGFLGIFMIRKVLGSLSEVLHDSTKPKETIAEQENNF